MLRALYHKEDIDENLSGVVIDRTTMEVQRLTLQRLGERRKMLVCMPNLGCRHNVQHWLSYKAAEPYENNNEVFSALYRPRPFVATKIVRETFNVVITKTDEHENLKKELTSTVALNQPSTFRDIAANFIGRVQLEEPFDLREGMHKDMQDGSSTSPSSQIAKKSRRRSSLMQFLPMINLISRSV
eukprot:Gb_00069 [translate_table: standard]